MKEYPFQTTGPLDNIEVEGKETIQLPNGEVFEFKGRSHKAGGIKVMAPDGSRIYSQHLRLDKDVVEEITGKRKKMSPAQLSKEYDPTGYLDILKDKSPRTNSVRRDTARLMATKMMAMQDVIFNAQEGHKDYNSEGSFRMGGKVKTYNNGGETDGSGGNLPDNVIWSEAGIPGSTVTPQNIGFPEAYTTTGWSAPNPDSVDLSNPRFINSYHNPLANHPFFTEGSYQRRGQLTGKDQENLLSYQRALSYPQQELGLDDRSTAQFNNQLARRLRSSTRSNPDQFLTADIVVDGQTIPVAQATDDQIDRGELKLFNKRTGMPDLVDGRNGNVGDATNNQNFFPTIETIYRIPSASDEELTTRIPTIGGVEGAPRELPDSVKIDASGVAPDDKPNGRGQRLEIDPETLRSGVQAGLDLANLLTLEQGVPQYQYVPLQNATTRTDPINTLREDRAFNAAREALEKSNLPEQVKQAQLNQLTAQNAQSGSQTALTNFQNSQNTANQNVQRNLTAVNTNSENRVRANEAYLQQLSRGRYLMEQQRQEYVDRLMENYRTYHQNRQNLTLVNQLSRNYNFDPRTGQVNYQQGQGTPNLFDNLDAFKTGQ